MQPTFWVRPPFKTVVIIYIIIFQDDFKYIYNIYMGDDFIIDDYNSIIEDQDDYACNRFPILQDRLYHQ